MNSYVVAMLPIIVFLCLNILNKDDMKQISWDVLWLVAGGLTLGMSLTQTGLADVLVSNIPFSSFSVGIILLLTAVLGIVVANFMSNTATANLLIPIIALIGSTVPALEVVGGGAMLILTATFAISLGMCLPISTPPNVLAYGTGLISSNNLAKIGLLIGCIGLVLAFAGLYLHQYLGFI